MRNPLRMSERVFRYGGQVSRPSRPQRPDNLTLSLPTIGHIRLQPTTHRHLSCREPGSPATRKPIAGRESAGRHRYPRGRRIGQDGRPGPQSGQSRRPRPSTKSDLGRETTPLAAVTPVASIKECPLTFCQVDELEQPGPPNLRTRLRGGCTSCWRCSSDSRRPGASHGITTRFSRAHTFRDPPVPSTLVHR